MAALETNAPEKSVTTPERVAPETWACARFVAATTPINRNITHARLNDTEAFNLYSLFDFMALLY
jgi:hypothetical protein